MRLLSILPFLGILIAAAALAEHSKCRLALTFPVVLFTFPLLIYASGCFGSLLPGLYACWAVILACAVYLAFRIGTKRFDFRRFCAPELWFLLAVYAFGLIVHRRETLIGWDESAHWILTLRNSFVLNQFGAVAASSAQYKTYPPAAAMFHYFFTKTAILYANTTVRMSVTVLTAGLLAPLLSVFPEGKRGGRRALIAGILLFTLPFFYFKNAYFGTQVDCLQGLALAAVISVYFLSDGKRIGMLTAAAGLVFLTLTKDSGLILALIAGAVLAADRLFFARRGAEGRRRIRACDVLTALAFVLLPVLAKLSWTGFLYGNGIAKEASDQLDFWMIDYVKSILSGRFREDYARSYRVQGFLQFWRSLLYDCNFHENTRFWLCGAAVPYSVRLLLSAALMALAVRVSQQKKRMRTAFALLFAGNLGWLLGISVLYLCRLTEAENAVLSSVSRYLGTGLIAMDTVSAAVLVRALAAPETDGKRARTARIVAAALSAVLLLPSLSVLFRPAAYDDYKGRALLSFAETPLDRTYQTYMAEYERIGPFLTDADDVLIVAKPQEHDTLWYKHALPPLQRVRVADAASLEPEMLEENSKLYLFPDADAALADAQLGHPVAGGQLECGALYRIAVRDGVYWAERIL